LIGAPRRIPSSDETPAQKPSSISVPPGAMTGALQRPRGKRLLALAAVVIGGVLLAQRYILSERVEGRELAARTERPEPSKHLEHTALEVKPSPSVSPTPSEPSSIVPTPSAEPLGERGTAATAVSAEEPNRAPATSSSTLPAKAVPAAPLLQPLEPAKRAPRRAEAPTRSASPSAPLTLATVEPSWGVTPSEPADKVDEAAQPGAAPPVPASSSGTGAPSPGAAKEPDPAAVEAPKPAASTAALSSEARAFASEQAREQLAAVASEASRCASLGATRGSGKVNVSIATWGRVVRVTHLNQAFVGTPVGVCVMEAFQRVQVPPFDGATQTLVGSFLIQ
jgi:hypothetical protein